MWPDYWPLIGQYWSRDLNTAIWLVNTGHVTWILSSGWSIQVTWPGYWPLIGWLWRSGDLTLKRKTSLWPGASGASHGHRETQTHIDALCQPFYHSLELEIGLYRLVIKCIFGLLEMTKSRITDIYWRKIRHWVTRCKMQTKIVWKCYT